MALACMKRDTIVLETDDVRVFNHRKTRFSSGYSRFLGYVL